MKTLTSKESKVNFILCSHYSWKEHYSYDFQKKKQTSNNNNKTQRWLAFGHVYTDFFRMVIEITAL